MGIQPKQALPAQKAIEGRPIAANDALPKAGESRNMMGFLRGAGRATKKTLANPTVQLYGAAGFTVASVACAVLLKEPNISGTIAGIGTGIEGLPQAIQSFRTKCTRDISLGFLTLNAATVAGFTTYGFMLHSIPLIVSDAFCFAFNSVPLAIKVREVIGDMKAKNEAKCADTEKDKDVTIDSAKAWGRFMRGVKDRISNPIVGLSAVAAPIVVAAGTMAGSIATGNPNIVGSFTAGVCGGIGIPQAIQSLRTRSVKDISLHSMLVCLSAEFNWITYGVMIKAPAVIAGDSGVVFFGMAPFVLKIMEVMGKKNAGKADPES